MNAALEGPQHRIIDRAIYCRDVSLFHTITRMRQAQAQFAIICQKKQSFTVKIEPPYGMEMAPFFWQEIVDGGAAEFVDFGADEAGRLVQGEVDRAVGADALAVERDAVVKVINPVAQFGARFAVEAAAAC